MAMIAAPNRPESNRNRTAQASARVQGLTIVPSTVDCEEIGRRSRLGHGRLALTHFSCGVDHRHRTGKRRAGYQCSYIYSTLCIPLSIKYIECTEMAITEFMLFVLTATLRGMFLCGANDL